jgi:hypothetical protein
MPAHKDLMSPAHAFTAADCAIPLVAERSMMALTAKMFFSIFFSPDQNDGMPLVASEW